MVVYDSLGAFSYAIYPATTGTLFSRLSHGHHLPEDLTAGFTLEHANITLLSSDFLVKVFEEIGRADQQHVSPGKVYRHITQGLLQTVHQHLNRLRLSPFPLVCKGRGAGANLNLDVGCIHLAGIRKDGLFVGLFDLAERRKRRLVRLCPQICIVQVIGHICDLVQDTALMRYTPQMALERLFKTLRPSADNQWRRLFRDPFAVHGAE
jgi:hypothetical protein